MCGGGWGGGPWIGEQSWNCVEGGGAPAVVAGDCVLNPGLVVNSNNYVLTLRSFESAV